MICHILSDKMAELKFYDIIFVIHILKFIKVDFVKKRFFLQAVDGLYQSKILFSDSLRNTEFLFRICKNSLSKYLTFN